MCCQNLGAHCQKRRHGSMSMLRCRCVSVSLLGWRSQQWERESSPFGTDGTVHLIVVLFYSLKQRNQITALINKAFYQLQEVIVGWKIHPAVWAHTARHSTFTVMCSLESKRVIDWDHLKPQGLGWLLASIPPEECCFIADVSLFFLFCFVFSMQRHGENPHGHRQQVPKHPAGTETNKEIQCQTPTSCSQWILLVDLRPGTRFGAYNKLIHDFISMHAFKLNTLNINGIHSACGNAVLGIWTLA